MTTISRHAQVDSGSRAGRTGLCCIAFVGTVLGCSSAGQGSDAAAGHGGDRHDSAAPEDATVSCTGEAGHEGADGAAGASDAEKPADAANAPDSAQASCTNACTAGATQCASGTTLRTCAVAANGCTAWSASACATGTVCERIAPAACVDPMWAEWPMPNGTNDVNLGAPTLQHFVDNLDGTVTDTTTDLMWEQAFHVAAFGAGFCETSVAVGGYSDWREPTIIELVSIVDYGRRPSLDTDVFPHSPGGAFWSSTLRQGFGDATFYTFDFDQGFMRTGEGGGQDPLSNRLRCVR